MEILEKPFGVFNGLEVTEYTLVNDGKEVSVSCLNYGCVITKIMVPDNKGNVENVVLGFDTFDEYKNVSPSPYFGAVVGRVAGRIKNARFELDGREYKLSENASPNHIHGGENGFSSVIWETEKIKTKDSIGLKFDYRSPDGEEGYPGNLDTSITYLLNNKNELSIKYEACTDEDTIINLTNHSYFNLSGNVKRDCTMHSLQLMCDYFVELGGNNIPTGRMLQTTNTPFDFRKDRRLREGIHSSHPQNILVGNGYDHPLVFAKEGENEIKLKDDESGRNLTITTDQPCVVLYTGNHLASPHTVSGVPLENYLGVCLETQGIPDAINNPNFPSTLLKQGEIYYTKTNYRFFVNKTGV